MLLKMIRGLYDRPLTVRSMFGSPNVETLSPDESPEILLLGGNTPFHVPESKAGNVESTDDPILAKSLFIDRMDHVGAPLYIARFKDCIVTASGAIVTNHGSILLESLYPNIATDYLNAFKSDFLVKDGIVELTRNDLTIIDDDVVYAREIGEYGYFHWINSVLPRFHFIDRARRSASDRLMVANITEFARQSLDCLGQTHGIVPLVGSHHYVRDLAFLSPWIVENNHFTRPPEIRDFYYNLKSKLGIANSTPHKNLYISRNDVALRRLSNEPEVIDSLQHRGFVATQLSGMDFKMQMELFHDAKICIGVHGAGLSNIAFMQPGSTVVEIISPDRLWPTYRSLAARIGVNYVCLAGKRDPSSHVGTLGNDNILVDIDALSEVLDNCTKC